MSDLSQAVEKEIIKQPDHDDTLCLWREIWKRYEHQGLDAVSGYLDELLAVPEEDQ
jgi:hypothetical protein